MNRDEYNECCDGFFIKYAAIKNKKTFLFSMVEDPSSSEDELTRSGDQKILAREGDFQYRLLLINLEKSYPYAYVTWPAGINRATITHCSKDGQNISVDFNGGVWESSFGIGKWPSYQIPQTDPMEALEKEEPKRLLNAPSGFSGGMLAYITELREIEGDIYACGGIRKVLHRKNAESWKDITLTKTHPKLNLDIIEKFKKGKGVSSYSGFSSVHGFTKNDIYACGSGGDCWHYNGVTWVKMDIPTNVALNKLICADDGYVYIAAYGGIIIKGRYSHTNKPEAWQIITSDLPALKLHPFEGIAWFNKKLYVSTSYGLYQLDDNKLINVDFGKAHQFSFQGVVATNEVLLSFGPYNALIFDGKKWRTIVSSFS